MEQIDLYANTYAFSCASSNEPRLSQAAEMSESALISASLNLSSGMDLAKLEDTLVREIIEGMASIDLGQTEADDDEIQDPVPTPELPTSSQSTASKTFHLEHLQRRR
jgi:hypothetical protein